MTDTIAATIVVGIDDSDATTAVLRHAVHEAARRHGAVHVVAAYEPPEGWFRGFGLDGDLDLIRDATRVRAQTAIDRVLADPAPGLGPTPAIDLDVVAGPAADVLVEASQTADLLVVGHRDRGLLRSSVLGSVGLSCVLHASCPVTVVPAGKEPPATPTDGSGTVVVGVDGSPGSREALQQALRDADRRGDRVLAVAVYTPPERWGAWTVGLAVAPDRSDIEGAVLAVNRRLVDEVVRSMRPELTTEPKVEVEARPGSAAEVLTEASRGADALHVGHRGRGAVSSAALGSVGLGCVALASCPVTVVLPAHGRPAADRHAPHRPVGQEGEPPGVQAAENELAYERHPRRAGHREGEPISEQARDAVRAPTTVGVGTPDPGDGPDGQRWRRASSNASMRSSRSSTSARPIRFCTPRIPRSAVGVPRCRSGPRPGHDGPPARGRRTFGP